MINEQENNFEYENIPDYASKENKELFFEIEKMKKEIILLEENTIDRTERY